MPYTIKIDRTLCSGYGDCVGLAPDVFAHDEENISVVVDPEGAVLPAQIASPDGGRLSADEDLEDGLPDVFG